MLKLLHIGLLKRVYKYIPNKCTNTLLANYNNNLLRLFFKIVFKGDMCNDL